ncbi:MAG: acylphosphatase [Euryarchaeota archaeon]|nr:acylphosphatase [Euryarchaeota archaeon]
MTDVTRTTSEEVGKDTVRRKLCITGKVQGVWFRDSARQEAERLGGVTGWIKNDPDGSVVAEVQGPADKVERFVQWCHKGPDAARVDKVETTTKPVEGDESRFQVTR